MVATTLNSPQAIRSISLSIWSSVEEGEFKMEYEESCWDGPGWLDMGDVATGGGGRREYSDADGAMKERYWSTTYDHRRVSVRFQKSSLVDLFYELVCPILRDRPSKLFQQ